MGATFVELVLQNLMGLLPFIIVYSYERAVRWTWGKDPVELGPGIHWKLYFYHRAEVVQVVDDVIELPIQSVTTKDEKLVCFSVNVGYKVQDVVKHFCEVTDFKSSLVAMAMTHLAQRVRQKTMAELMGDLKGLEESLKGTLTTKLKEWGTDVFSVGFTNFAQVPTQFRVFGIGDHRSPRDHLVG